MIEADVIVEHPEFGKGEILMVTYDTGVPVVSVAWEDGTIGCYSVDVLEFLVI